VNIEPVHQVETGRRGLVQNARGIVALRAEGMWL
jgi:hypothetical protein